MKEWRQKSNIKKRPENNQELRNQLCVSDIDTSAFKGSTIPCVEPKISHLSPCTLPNSVVCYMSYRCYNSIEWH